MPRYRALERCFDGTRLHEEGDIFDYDGPPGKAMVLIEDEEEPPQPAAAPVTPRQPRTAQRTPAPDLLG